MTALTMGLVYTVVNIVKMLVSDANVSNLHGYTVLSVHALVCKKSVRQILIVFSLL